MLSQRKREVLKLIALGYHAKEIAHTVGISIHTAEEHIEGLRKLLHAKSNAEAIYLAVKCGLLIVEATSFPPRPS